MLDHLAAANAMNTRLLTLSVVSTTSATLAATATGYTRASGSFVADLLAKGMESTPVGFPANPVDVITEVTATAITTKNAHATATADAGRSFTVRLPLARVFDNIDPGVPAAGIPWVRTEFVPATNRTDTLAANRGRAEETGVYFVTFHVQAGVGAGALRRYADATLALFASGTLVAAGSEFVKIPRNPGPYAGQILPGDPGFAYVQVTIPWHAFVENLVAA